MNAVVVGKLSDRSIPHSSPEKPQWKENSLNVIMWGNQRTSLLLHGKIHGEKSLTVEGLELHQSLSIHQKIHFVENVFNSRNVRKPSFACHLFYYMKIHVES